MIKPRKRWNHTQYKYSKKKRQSSRICSLLVEDSVSLKMRVTTWEKAMLSSPRPLSPLKFPLWQKRKSLKQKEFCVHPTFEKYPVPSSVYHYCSFLTKLSVRLMNLKVATTINTKGTKHTLCATASQLFRMERNFSIMGKLKRLWDESYVRVKMI